MHLSTVDLQGEWILEPQPEQRHVPPAVAAAGEIPANVPGTVHTDLMKAGLLVDPYLDTNELQQHWIGVTDWRYRKRFDFAADASDRVDLVFEGLDTVAEVTLNGTVVLSSRNQHRTYRVAVQHLLQETGNELEVSFSAPVPAADRASLELEYRPHVNHHPYNAIRKMASSFGWDWGLDTSTSGIWGPVRLERFARARIAETVLVPTVVDGTGVLDIRVSVEEATGPTTLRLIAEIDGRRFETVVEDRSGNLRIEIPEVRRWWPRGYGEQDRYRLRLELREDDTVLDSEERRVGFRTVELDTSDDADGTAFVVVVNGRRIYVRGVNWITDDAFPHRVDRARYAERLDQAVRGNVNLIRVWGGGIYESEDFYDLADEYGLLIWQDFLLACAAYAEEQPLAEEIEAEAREVIPRLAAHPSLVILNGNNENIWGHDEWGWAPALEGRSWGLAYYLETFPRLVAEYAPHVSYTPGSPFSPRQEHAPNSPEHGTMHIWELWNRVDYPGYRDIRPRFVSEFGWQGPPTWSTLTASIADDPLTPESPGMLVHQKAMEGNAKLTNGLVNHIPLPNDMQDWHWAMSLNQAVAVRTALEWFRSLQPYCMGTIIWQLNDCWPVVSWSAIDGYGRLKPLWYAMRDAYAERLLTIQPAASGGLHAVVVNDTDTPWTGTAAVTRRRLDGTTIAAHEEGINLDARSTLTLPLPQELSEPEDPGAELLEIRVGTERGLWFFAEPRDSALQPAAFDSSARRVDDHHIELTITAQTLLRELAVLADVAEADAEADRMLLTLLPGETAVITIATTPDIAPHAFLDPRVVRTLNDLV